MWLISETYYLFWGWNGWFFLELYEFESWDFIFWCKDWIFMESFCILLLCGQSLKLSTLKMEWMVISGIVWIGVLGFHFSVKDWIFMEFCPVFESVYCWLGGQSLKLLSFFFIRMIVSGTVWFCVSLSRRYIGNNLPVSR